MKSVHDYWGMPLMLYTPSIYYWHTNIVLRGKLRTAVQWITERETGEVLQPGDRCTKTGDRVMEVLCGQPGLVP